MVTVEFNSQGGSAVASQEIVAGTAATEPEAPTREGYTFQGWYKDAEGTEAWNFDTIINENTTLYAQWKANDPVEPSEDQAAWFFIRSDGKIPFEDGTTGYLASEYEPQHPGNGETGVNMLTGTLYQAQQVYVNYEGPASGVTPGELSMFDVVSDAIKSAPSDAAIQAAVPDYNPETQMVLWYVVKNHDGGHQGGCPDWHVDGVICDKDAVYVGLTYDANLPAGVTDNVTVPASVLCPAGSTFIVGEPSAKTISGYTFAGWKDQNDTVYQPDDEITVNENTTLYAQWKADEPVEPSEDQAAWFFIRSDGVIPFEDGTTGYLASEYEPQHPGNGETGVNMLTGELYQAQQVYVNYEGPASGVTPGELSMFDAVSDAIKSAPSDAAIQAAVPDYNPETQMVLWYVVKNHDGGHQGGCPDWHVDGVICDKDAVYVGLTYDANLPAGVTDNVMVPASVLCPAGSTFTVGEPGAKTISGYTFEGWKDQNNKAYQPGEEITVNENTTLYAQWKANEPVEPTEPEKPSVDDLNALLNVVVDCTSNEDHADKTYENLLADSYTVSAVTNSACTVTIQAAPYVADYGNNHTLSDSASKTVNLVYDNGWKLAAGASGTVTFTVICTTDPGTTDPGTTDPGATNPPYTGGGDDDGDDDITVVINPGRTPTTSTPETSEEPTEIPEPSTPMTDLPEDSGEDIPDDNDVPLGDQPDEPTDPGKEIPDGNVPMSDLPQTGAVAAPVNPATTASLVALAFSMAGCGLYFTFGRKKGEEEE